MNNSKSNELNLFEDYHPFYFQCFDPQFREAAKQVYTRLPTRVKRLVNKYFVHVCDHIASYKDPTKKVPGMPIGMYHVGTGIIDIIPQTPPLSDKALMGVIVHETAHAYVDKKLLPLQRLFFKILFKTLSYEEKYSYPYSEELHVNWLARRWGFKEEIAAMEEERIIQT